MMMTNAFTQLGCLAILLTIVSFISAEDPILGRWQRLQKTPDGNIDLMADIPLEADEIETIMNS